MSDYPTGADHALLEHGESPLSDCRVLLKALQPVQESLPDNVRCAIAEMRETLEAIEAES